MNSLVGSNIRELNEDLKHLQIAIATNNIDVVDFLKNKYCNVLPSSSSSYLDVSFCETNVDTFSRCLLPRDVSSHLAPVKATGNGDCFFNSASILLVGNESLCNVLRLLVTAEIFSHATCYGDHPR